MTKFIAYTDGSSSPKSEHQIGGWGFVMYPMGSPETALEQSGGEQGTTNQRMEMMGIIKACTFANSLAHNDGDVHLHVVSDSRYCLDGIQSWIHGWKKAGWHKSGGPIKNLDLWKQMYILVYESNLKCTFEWVKGHSGDQFNDIADRLATEAKRQLKEQLL